MAPACRNACLSISAFVSSRAEAYGKGGTRYVKYCHKSAPPSPRFKCIYLVILCNYGKASRLRVDGILINRGLKLFKSFDAEFALSQ